MLLLFVSDLSYVQQTPIPISSFSNVDSLIKLILHMPCKNSHKPSAQTFAWHMTFYNPVHIRETKKSSLRCLYAHGQTDSNCKTFCRTGIIIKARSVLFRKFRFPYWEEFTAHFITWHNSQKRKIIAAHKFAFAGSIFILLYRLHQLHIGLYT